VVGAGALAVSGRVPARGCPCRRPCRTFRLRNEYHRALPGAGPGFPRQPRNGRFARPMLRSAAAAAPDRQPESDGATPDAWTAALRHFTTASEGCQFWTRSTAACNPSVSEKRGKRCTARRLENAVARMDNIVLLRVLA